MFRWFLPITILAAAACLPPPAEAYITVPVPTLGAAVADSTYATVVRVEKVSVEAGVIVYSKVRDLKGKYPRDKIRHVFDLKNTPQHKGSGDVPVRPNEKDWRHALTWAAPGKTAVMLSRKYDPFGDFGHTYIDGCWYATMCPARDWDLWYAIYADANLLKQWHAGTPVPLVAAVEALASGRDAVTPVMATGDRDVLRAGKATFTGHRHGLAVRDYNPGRDRLPWPLDAATVPGLLKGLSDPSRDERARTARTLGLYGSAAKGAVSALAEVVRNDPSGTARIAAADALAAIGPEAKAALPALESARADPRMAGRKDVHDKLVDAIGRLR